MTGVVDRMGVRPNDRVLHVGFGDGEITRQLARLVRDGMVLGVDPSDDNMRLARRLSAEIDNVMFVLGSLEEIPWQEAYFTAVLCSGPVQDWGRAAAEIFRVTASGGRAYFPDAAAAAESRLRSAGFEIRRGLLLEARKP